MVLWEQVYKPALTYGVEVMSFTKLELKTLDAIQNSLGRRLLGLSGRAPLEGVLGELGWKRFDEEIREKRIGFYNFLLCIEIGRWSAQVSSRPKGVSPGGINRSRKT